MNVIVRVELNVDSTALGCQLVECGELIAMAITTTSSSCAQAEPLSYYPNRGIEDEDEENEGGFKSG